ncbi:MAG: hypothetical protein HFK04_03395 [Oscillospiraceae bacterium]|nr:hypothetical protein [Oscillospiraceae bacterium]
MNQTEHMERDIYSRTLATAKGYYAMLRRRRILPQGPVQQKNDERIEAVEKAWMDCQNVMEREVIQKNLFEGLPMQHIPVYYSIRAMKRIRKNFLVRLAKNLKEI